MQDLGLFYGQGNSINLGSCSPITGKTKDKISADSFQESAELKPNVPCSRAEDAEACYQRGILSAPKRAFVSLCPLIGGSVNGYTAFSTNTHLK
jgi:hypothetical protein